MTTFKFLKDYIQDEAIVTIANNRGDINYTGKLIDMPFSVIKGTEVEKVEGIGSENDLIITVF